MAHPDVAEHRGQTDRDREQRHPQQQGRDPDDRDRQCDHSEDVRRDDQEHGGQANQQRAGRGDPGHVRHTLDVAAPAEEDRGKSDAEENGAQEQNRDYALDPVEQSEERATA